ncbi:MAG: hypothetical protein KAT62_12540 [Desulfuromonadales bacterium]|nr:hypothetical protein [Desulfuromonadales bacterium]
MTEQQNGSAKVQIKVPAEVAKIMSKWGGHSVRLAAARGALPMSGPNLVTVLFIFYHGENAELKKEALGTLRMLPTNILLAALNSPELHSSIIDLIVRLRYRDVLVMEVALRHRMIGLRTLMLVAEKGSGEVLDILSHNDQVLNKAQALRTAIINNPNADKVMKLRLGWVEPQPESAPEDEPEPVEAIEEPEEIEEEALSKYQQILEMPVAEKIKMALTGDKEWRTLLIREANKMVSTAVLKNPRISEGEVLSVAKNRSSSDELIRIILLNREWVKKYEIKKALVVHPRTPLQKSMRFMTFLTEKDVRELAKSRNVSQAIVNNARRMLMSKKR